MADETKKVEEKVKRLSDLLGKDEDTTEDAELVASLLNEKGDLKVDTSLPKELETEVMAQMLIDHIISFRQTRQAWIAAKQTADHARRQQLFQQMQYNQLTIAIIQHQYPEAKPIAELVARQRARTLQDARRSLKED